MNLKCECVELTLYMFIMYYYLYVLLSYIVKLMLQEKPSYAKVAISQNIAWGSPVPDYVNDSQKLLQKLEKEITSSNKKEEYVATPDKLLEMDRTTALVNHCLL